MKFLAKFLTLTATCFTLTTAALLSGCQKDTGVVPARPAAVTAHSPVAASGSLARTYTQYSDYATDINRVGSMHNDCMDYLYNYVTNTYGSSWSTMSTGDRNDVISQKIVDFFADHGQDVSAYTSLTYDPSYTVSSSTVSSKAYDIYNDLLAAGDSYLEGTMSQTDFDQTCESLKQLAYGLSDETESVSIGAAVSVGQNSFQYWKQNYATYATTFGNPVPTTPSAMSAEQARVGRADLKGAIRGGFFGAFGGLAGAIVGASWGAACDSFSAAVFG